MPTIRDVAKACGVSPMTVSFVLNNKPGQVSHETRERVLKAVREMGYRPAAGRASPERLIKTIGVVAGVPGDSLMQPGYYNAAANGILRATDEFRLNVLLFTHSLLHIDTRRSIRVYCDGKCDGLLVLAPHPGSKLVESLHERGFPFVLIGDIGDHETVSCVDVDNLAEAKKVVDYLVSRGHRRIGFVGGPDFVRSAMQRLEGYRRTLAEHGIPYDHSLVQSGVVRESELVDRVAELVDRRARARPTALFCWNDGSARRTIEILHDMGLRVPQDLSVIGYDDAHGAESIDPPLTTVRQPYHEIGRRAVEILMDLMCGRSEGPRREILTTQLVERESVASLPPISGHD